MKTKHKIHLASLFFPILIMLVIFIGREIYPFGDESFLHSDMYHQYMPFFSEFLHKLRNGESLFYSWNVGMGSNFLALYVYYLASPFNWLAALVPEHFLLEFMTYLIVLKIGLCGLTFSIYLRKHFHSTHYSIVLFSCFYALSGFIAAYNWDIMWLDCIFLAPLILLGLEQLVAEGKWLLYCITLALSILSNYYISIMICIYLVLYFIVMLINKPAKWKSLFRFIPASLLAGGLSCILLIPELTALYVTEFGDFNFPQKISSYFSVMEMLMRHCVNVTTEQGLDHWPNLYCGVAVMLLLPLYVLNRKIPLREKITKIALAGFLLISFSTNILNFIWHGFNYPDSLPCRQSFLYILLLLTLCYEAFHHLKEAEPRQLWYSFFGALLFTIIGECVIKDTEAYPFGAFLGTYILLTVYGCILYLYHKEVLIGGKEKAARFFAVSLTLLVLLESGMNMAVTSVTTTSRSKYLSGHDAYETLVSRLRETDSSFYRIEKFSRITKNDATMIGFPSVSVFSSTANSHVGDLFEKLGMSNSKVFYCYEGATPFSSALMSIQYMFSRSSSEDQGLYTLIDQEDDVYLYRNRYALPLGYIVDQNFTLSSEDEDSTEDVLEAALDEYSASPLETQNRLSSALGICDPLFTHISSSTDGVSTIIVSEQDSYLYAYVNNDKVKKATLSVNGETTAFEKLNHDYVIDLGFQKAGTRMELTGENDEPLFLSAYAMDETVLASAITRLGEQPFVTDSFDSTHVFGHIEVHSPGELVLTIPYEPGWTVKVDGVKTEPNRFADTMISIPLDSGNYSIELSYYPAGLTIGILISSISIIILVLLLVWNHRKKKSHISSQLPEAEAPLS